MEQKISHKGKHNLQIKIGRLIKALPNPDKIWLTKARSKIDQIIENQLINQLTLLGEQQLNDVRQYIPS